MYIMSNQLILTFWKHFAGSMLDFLVTMAMIVRHAPLVHIKMYLENVIAYNVQKKNIQYIYMLLISVHVLLVVETHLQNLEIHY